MGFCIRVGGRVSHLHEVWLYTTWMWFQKILIGLPDVGLFGSKETLGLLLSQGVVGSWIHFVLTACPYTAC